jgi:hypothetical protein
MANILENNTESSANDRSASQKMDQQVSKTIKNSKNICTLLFLIFSLLSMAFTLFIVDKKKEETANSLNTMIVKVAEKASNLTALVRNIEPIVEKLADDIASGKVKIADIDDRVKSDLKRNKWMYGLGVSFEPYEVSTEKRLWSQYYIVGTDNNINKATIDYDYTRFEYAWYRKPLLEGKYWNEPYFGEASKALIAEYGVPFWLPGKKEGVDDPSGVIFGNLSINKLKSLAKIDHDYIAYYHILSKQGRFVVHPNETLVFSGNTIFEYAWEREDTSLNSMAIHAVAGESGHISHIDPVTSDQGWMIYEPLLGLGWSLVVVIDKNRLLDIDEMRRQWFLLVPLLIISAAMLSIAVLFSRTLVHQHLMFTSIVVSFVMFAGVAALWRVAEQYPKQIDNNELKVMSANILMDFENKQKQAAKDIHMIAPKFIKTGVYLQSVEFEGANNVKISGYVWQHYKKHLHKGIRRGVIFPEAETPNIQEVYREMVNPADPDCHVGNDNLRDCDELIGWYVYATLRQEFDYSLFPLDSQQVWLRIWHQDFKDNIILVPDLNSYAFPNPKLTPGVQQGFVLPGWEIEESWFSFKNQLFNTNFGSLKAHGLKNKPELLYNINIQRKFLNPFVSRIIPVVLISILMFLIVLISTKSSKAAEWLGFSASDVVLGLSALFFVVGINHTDLRQSLQSSNIMYFEYFYFVIYVMLLYVAVSSIYIAKHESIEGRDENLISKLLYWPVLSLVLFIITFFVFF